MEAPALIGKLASTQPDHSIDVKKPHSIVRPLRCFVFMAECRICGVLPSNEKLTLARATTAIRPASLLSHASVVRTEHRERLTAEALTAH